MTIILISFLLSSVYFNCVIFLKKKNATIIIEIVSPTLRGKSHLTVSEREREKAATKKRYYTFCVYWSWMVDLEGYIP